MIQEKLFDYNYDTEQTINFLIGQQSLADDDNQSKSRPKKSTNTHKNKKMEKKMRQMERQKLNHQLQVIEKNDAKMQLKGTNSDQQNQLHMLAEAEDLNILAISSIQTKLI